MQKSTSLKHEPASELLLMSAKQLFLNREPVTRERRGEARNLDGDIDGLVE